MKNTQKIALTATLLAMSASLSSAAIVLEYDFEANITDWTGNGQVVGLTQTTASTGEGVLQHTSGAAQTDPIMNLDNGIGWLAPGAGETWTTVTIRSRNFDAPTPNTDPQTFTTVQDPYDNVGTLMLNKGGGGAIFENYLGNQTVGAADANGWVITTYDVSARGSLAFDNMRFDFVSGGNVGVQVDYVRFNDTAPVPEPSSTALLGLGGLALILRRRK